MQLTCPWCGPRDIEEFTFGGDASVSRPAFDEVRDQAWYDYLYIRENPRGEHQEYWHHEAGCRQWLVVLRDTSDHRILTVNLARDVVA